MAIGTPIGYLGIKGIDWLGEPDSEVAEKVYFDFGPDLANQYLEDYSSYSGFITNRYRKTAKYLEMTVASRNRIDECYVPARVKRLLRLQQVEDSSLSIVHKTKMILDSISLPPGDSVFVFFASSAPNSYQIRGYGANSEVSASSEWLPADTVITGPVVYAKAVVKFGVIISVLFGFFMTVTILWLSIRYQRIKDAVDIRLAEGQSNSPDTPSSSGEA
ncbi:MAG: hypothetical protein OEW00_06310 [candidate division Zixibacteria bacterium]|nr:hypothetical protein [candidate division Zixibacteria bacterium]